MVQKKSIILYAVLFTALITYITIFWVFAIKLDPQALSGNSLNHYEKTIEIPSGWQYHWGDSPLDNNGHFLWLDNNSSKEGWVNFQFPGRPKNNSKFDAIWVKTVLPVADIEHASFRFRAPQQIVEVYLEDKLIYSYGNYDPSNKVRTPGSKWHFAELPSNFSGKTIYFRLQTPFPQYTGYFIETAVGNKSAHLFDIYLQNILHVIFGSLFILIGAAILLIQLSGSHKWRDIKYLGLGSIFIGGWYLSESRIPQLFINAPVSVIYAANFFIFLQPVWLLIYVEHSFTIKSSIQRRLLQILWVLHALLAFVAFTLDILGLISQLHFVIVLHVMLPITMGLIAFTVIKAAKNDMKGALFFVSGILVFGITGLCDTFMMFYNI